MVELLNDLVPLDLDELEEVEDLELLLREFEEEGPAPG